MALHHPGSDEYVRATTPHNAAVAQRPAAVAVLTDVAGAADAVGHATRRGLRIVVQATGHGVTGDLSEDTLLVDTSRLDAVSVDPGSAVVTAGAGATWQAVNAAAQRHGLLAASGSAPDVGVAGYSFGGGVGWLTPLFGLAADALRSVTYLDGAGALREARDDAADVTDRDAMWAFRGGGGAGLAVALTFDVFAVSDVHAGYLLWPVEHLDAVAQAWAAALDATGEVASSVAVLRAAPGPPFPPSLRGDQVVHLAVAAPRGGRSAQLFRDALSTAPPPMVDTVGPADATALAHIHLDPPPGTPALGLGRWVDANAPAHVAAVLRAAASIEEVAMAEFRNVGTIAGRRAGALTSTPGPYLLHAVSPAGEPAQRAPALAALDRLREAAAVIDIGRGAASFADGRRGDDDCLPEADRDRLAAVVRAVDPAGVFAATRVPSGPLPSTSAPSAPKGTS